MKKIIVVLLLLGIAILVVPKNTAHGQPNDDFIIVGADASNMLSFTGSSDLGNLIANVDDRFVIQFAKKNQYYELSPAPSELLTLIGQVGDRFVISFAKQNKFYNMSYPLDLIGDHTPPQAGIPTVSGNGFNGVKISWTTNEYTISVLDYGIQSGIYTNNVTDNLYNIQHVDLLSGLTPGETYYYRITDTDRSGNTIQGQEFTFTVTLVIYLPIVKR